ncbi:uncharacterized protein LOC119634253 [Glossina fuscipes]|uniref:Uncharacterized protein LOC119634253 n=1 Tax=Glossina fuscipes TaxID=7396 RepID=A0A8U0WGF3_9MUSC|nr:uncharacterized protein LOC119634253 [Glossina fuscipes]XP_037884253.1 uncharacterized protein LOC119634253 [Glossina fuscipes]XP_037884254.1 uncharacterized protein LOC119634253 [Glossina fuscipes]XP_037884255.1 uncharacterized protein LOC119634253 [Glossina fuscipes]KAI9586437.1 hypothetical protein GQX74_002284 [Glossina fuscipes]
MAKISRRALASSTTTLILNNSTSGISTSTLNNQSSTAFTSAATRTYATNSEESSTPTSYSFTGNSSYPDPLRLHNANDSGVGEKYPTYTYTTTTLSPNKYVPFTASPIPADIYNKTLQAQILAAERERIRAEFFATYDVMTGVRIAATLGGFFGLMVFLIVWKSRSSSNETMKVLKDPKMAAVAAVCMQEEEEREIQEAMVATGLSIYPDEYDAILYRRQRMLSLGNVSAPPMLNRGFRFSSVGGGGYSSLLEPPRRFSFSAASGALSIGGGSYVATRKRSGSETSRIFSNYPMGSFGADDYFMETDDEVENGDYVPQDNAKQLNEVGREAERKDSIKSKHGFLKVPLTGQDSRRSSAMTCCSSDSSYLERRYSAFTLGMANLPNTLQRKHSTASRTSSTDNWDYYYPDIQVIQPTPKSSPCPSERSIYDQLQSHIPTQTIKTTTSSATSTVQTNSRGVISSTVTTSKTVKPTSSLTPLRTSISSVPSTTKVQPSATFIRKHSIAYYDPESAQSGRKQQIHSISADTVDVYPYNQPLCERGIYEDLPPMQIPHTPPSDVRQNLVHPSESPMEDIRLNARRKVAVVELPRIPYPEQTTPPSLATLTCENNNTFSIFANTAAALAAANSSSISVDSTPLSIDKLNGSGSLGTVSAKAIFNANRRAPLASLSSFKISSLEYQDSEMRSLDEDSVFIESAADTDEDMQQLSSDSEEVSLGSSHEIDLVAQDHESLVPDSAEEQDSIRGAIPRTCHLPAKYCGEKRYSLGESLTVTPTINATNLLGSTAITASARARRSLLQRHRTISVSSSDRVTLLGQQLKEFPSSGTQTPSSSVESRAPLETHFGAIICTNSPPAHQRRRAQLLQQYSDPYSQPTTTTTTTTTATEEETCSTMNTELGAVGVYGGIELSVTPDSLGGTDVTTTASNETAILGSGGRASTSLTQHSSLATVISFGHVSPLTESQTCTSASLGVVVSDDFPEVSSKHKHAQQQLPLALVTNDPCGSSISDSFIQQHHHPLISMPSSLKSLIVRGSSSQAVAKLGNVSRSATNLTSAKEADDDSILYADHRSPCPSLMLELPLIKLPTEDSSPENSLTSELNADVEPRQCKSDQTGYSSLPGSARKWSRETLF